MVVAGKASGTQADFGGGVGVRAQANSLVLGFLDEGEKGKRQAFHTRSFIKACDETRFTFVEVSHGVEADWLRVQLRSGEGCTFSPLSSVFSASDDSGVSGVFGSALSSSSLSTSRATRLMKW